jgi:hypothetical protein
MIPHSKGDIIIPLFYFLRCLDCKREESKALREWERLYSMKMDPLDFFLPILRIDMDFMALFSHSGT